jgi:hypothetical protein
MLWDCGSCGTQKLLGKTHRRCPHCGAPQDPTKRYFPEPGQEVPVEGHVYVGVDWTCAACETPNSRAADFCVNCGNPREGNKDVARVAEQVLSGGRVVEGAAGLKPTLGRNAPPGFTVTTVPPPNRKKALVVAGGVFAAIVAFILVAIFWQKDVNVLVERHDWRREVFIDQMAARQDSSWCDSKPYDAYNVSSRREVRSHRQIPDGQECHDVRHDNGDGTFSTSTRCSTKYRSEPVYDDKCYYTVNRWGHYTTATANGSGSTSARAWPAFSVTGGSCLGCTRESSRRETLTLQLRSSTEAKKTWSCDVDEARWLALTDGSVHKMKVRVIGGGAVCDTLKP